MRVSPAQVSAAIQKAEKAFEAGGIPDKSTVRNLWEGGLETPRATTKESCFAALRRTFEEFSDGTVLGRSRSRDFIADDVPADEMKRIVRDRGESPLLMFTPGEVVVIPVMVSGVLKASVIYKALDLLGRKPHGHAPVGYNLHQIPALAGERSEPLKVNVSEAHEEYLLECARMGKTALIVDNYMAEGTTLSVITGYLRSMGFQMVYHMIDDVIYEIRRGRIEPFGWEGGI